jgi:hypothetical protein
VDEDLEQVFSWLRHPKTLELLEIVADALENPHVWRLIGVVADEMIRQHDEKREREQSCRSW